ncbi:hypothetical protein SAMN05421766_103540 [Zobellia uliginosa]|uniref:Uncharacterized protein n=1 Tax=Zobellia uliginosa TaxID=143224 RepID=A0ABY1KVW3_9FLAO|nr:hypothetical protein SAMN05421766_103540 [Zobellia uliginosa]
MSVIVKPLKRSVVPKILILGKNLHLKHKLSLHYHFNSYNNNQIFLLN